MQVGAIGSGMGSGSAAAVPSPRLLRAAREFEGQMMKELLQPLTDAGDGDDGSGPGGPLGAFASEALGQGLSAQGGFGIAQRIVYDLSRSGKQSDPGKVTGNLHQDTVLRSYE